MGNKFKHWEALTDTVPPDLNTLSQILLANRGFEPVQKLDYGDHGIERAVETVFQILKSNGRIALYADYDVDGTMSCVSWIWFFKAIGFTNFVHYIPCRFKEGYGVNLKAIQHLVEDEGAKLVLTMDTGITANVEAEYCRSRGVEFICTDHHKIQPEKMPHCIIVNPKLNPNALYQELCGCGITYVLLRRLGARFNPPAELWTDLLALVGMATICDVVPLNSVNHRLARQGVKALTQSRRPILQSLLEAASGTVGSSAIDEKDVGFRLGPRINAVGRLGHADQVIEAFAQEDPQALVRYMGVCNEQRKQIQNQIVEQARQMARARMNDSANPSILFLGTETWHTGVVGIAASKIAEEFWRPVWLYQKKDGIGKGSARSIPGFDVTEAMSHVKEHFIKFGGHRAAGGFSFSLAEETKLLEGLNDFAEKKRQSNPQLWESRINYDCELPPELINLKLTTILDEMKPYGNGFEEPRFCLRAKVRGVDYYNDKVTGNPRHTAVGIDGINGGRQKIMFFNEVIEGIAKNSRCRFVVTASRNFYNQVWSLSLMGQDYESTELESKS